MSVFVELSTEQREALGSLLEICRRLAQADRDSDTVPIGSLGLSQLAASVAHQSCRLAGIACDTTGETKSETARRLANETELIALHIEGSGRDWRVQVTAPSEKAVAHYSGGASRPTAVALGLVLLARTVLGRAPETRTPCCIHCGAVATCRSLHRDAEVGILYSCKACCVQSGPCSRGGGCQEIETVPSLEHELESWLEGVMSDFDDALDAADEAAEAPYVPAGYHRWVVGCDPSKKNPAGICNCPCPGQFGQGPELSCHGEGGVD